MTGIRFRLPVFAFALAIGGCGTGSAPPPSVIEVTDDDAGTRDSGAELDGACDGARCVGEECSKNGECSTGACFYGGSRHFCTKTCTSDGDCPSPPYLGTCNNQGYCRF